MFRNGKAGKTERSGQVSGLYSGVGALLLAIVFVGVLGVAPGSARGQAPASGNGEVTYPASMFDNGKARHFAHKTPDGITIRYFVMKSSDGVIRAAFDACDVCWREGKGYVQKDDTMLCRNCGRRFPSARINVVSGGCNPAPLVRNTEGGKVVIKVAHLLEGKRYFTFGGGRS